MSDKQHLRSRFQKNMGKDVQDYTASITFDRRLFKQDIAGSIAHANMLARQGIISKKDAELIAAGLVSIREEIEQGKFPFSMELEDIHMNIEARLAEKIGEVAGKLHTARSRNDQIALDMRLYAKDAIAETMANLKQLQAAFLDVAEENIDVALPGYTHLQRAQPVLLAHH
ncbi:MAG: lyase family protein, partial [Chloroflexota bacterium]